MTSIFQLILALGLTLGLVLALKKLLQRWAARAGFPNYAQDSTPIHIRGIKRLDLKRTLILVEEGGFEHLILLGPTNDIVVQTRPGSFSKETQS